MKCPECGGKQRRFEGMICKSCSYQFVLDPKQPPNITDAAMRKTIDKLSAKEVYYFTFHQLFAQIYRQRGEKEVGCLIFLPIIIIMSILVLFLLHIFTELNIGTIISLAWLYLSILLIIVHAIPNLVDNLQDFMFRTKKITQSYHQIAKAINDYDYRHPIRNMVRGNYFRKQIINKIDDEILTYAPERILIVEHDDVADMLILNRFHLENKVLVLSANKYPDHAFEAYQRIIRKNPDIPAELIHDVSIKGHHLKKHLLADSSWHLKENNIRDLGLSYVDVEKLREPMWIPYLTNEKIRNKGRTIDNIRDGYRIPSDIASPKAFIAGVSLTMSTGMVLLTEELLAEHQENGKDSGSGGGYG